MWGGRERGRGRGGDRCVCEREGDIYICRERGGADRQAGRHTVVLGGACMVAVEVTTLTCHPRYMQHDHSHFSCPPAVPHALSRLPMSPHTSQALIGYFDLDPNRVLDLVLDAAEVQPNNKVCVRLHARACLCRGARARTHARARARAHTHTHTRTHTLPPDCRRTFSWCLCSSVMQWCTCWASSSSTCR